MDFSIACVKINKYAKKYTRIFNKNCFRRRFDVLNFQQVLKEKNTKKVNLIEIFFIMTKEL